MECRLDNNEVSELEKISKECNNIALSTLMIQYHIMVAKRGYDQPKALQELRKMYNKKEPYGVGN